MSTQIVIMYYLVQHVDNTKSSQKHAYKHDLGATIFFSGNMETGARVS